MFIFLYTLSSFIVANAFADIGQMHLGTNVPGLSMGDKMKTSNIQTSTAKTKNALGAIEITYSKGTRTPVPGREIGFGGSRHYFNAGLNLGKDWSLLGTQSFDYLHFPEWRRVGKKNHVRKYINFSRVIWDDPAFGIKKKGILDYKRDGAQLDLTALYYAPMSFYAQKTIGTNADHGDGRARLQANFIKRMGPSPLLFASEHNAYAFLKKHPVDFGQSYYFELYHTIYYELSRIFGVFLSYNNYINMYNDWYKESWKTNQYAETGLDYAASKNLFLTTSVQQHFAKNDTFLQVFLNYKTF